MNESQEPETVICCLRCRSRSQRETARPEPERGSGKSDGRSPSLLSASRLSRLPSPEPEPGARYTRCRVAGPDPDIRAHHWHHKQLFYLFTWHQVKENRNNTQWIVEKSAIMTSTSPVRVSGTVSPQDCIYSSVKEEKGDYVKTNVIVAGLYFRENFYRCFLISWDNTWTHKILTRKWRDNVHQSRGESLRFWEDVGICIQMVCVNTLTW